MQFSEREKIRGIEGRGLPFAFDRNGLAAARVEEEVKLAPLLVSPIERLGLKKGMEDRRYFGSFKPAGARALELLP